MIHALQSATKSPTLAVLNCTVADVQATQCSTESYMQCPVEGRPLHRTTTSKPLPKLQYNRREAAHVLGVSLRTLDRLIAGNELAARRIGRRVLITTDTLTRFVKRDHRTEVM